MLEDIATNSTRSGGLTGWIREVPRPAWHALASASAAWFFEVFNLYSLALTTPALIAWFSITRAQAGAVASVSAGGAIVGGIAIGWIADKIGRTSALFWSVLIYSGFTGAITFSHSLFMLMALRFLGGIGMGGAWAAGATLVAETWPAAHRGKGGALMQIGTPLGSVAAIAVAGLISQLSDGLQHGAWRWIFAIGALPAIVVLPLISRTPESAVWLTKQKPLSRETATAYRHVFSMALAIGFSLIFFLQYIYWAVFSWTPTFLISVKHLSFLGGMGFTLAQQAGSLFGFIVFGAIVDVIGRRPTLFAYLLIGMMALVAFVLCTGPGVLGAACFALGFGVGGIFSGLGPFTAELLANVSSRAFAMSLAYNGGRVGGLIAPILVGVLARSNEGFRSAMLLTCIAFVAAMVVVGISPETKGRELV